MDLDFSIDVVSARPPIVEPMKARMKTLETYLIVLLLFIIIIVVIVVVILIVLVIAVVVVAITIAAFIVDIPSMVVSLARR